MSTSRIVKLIDGAARLADRALSFGREVPTAVPGPFVGGGAAEFSNKWFKHSYEIHVKDPTLTYAGAQALVQKSGAKIRPDSFEQTATGTLFQVTGMRGLDAGLLDDKGPTPDAVKVFSIGWE